MKRKSETENKIEKSVYDIPESHKRLVRRRIKETKKEDFIEWKTALKIIKEKIKLRLAK